MIMIAHHRYFVYSLIHSFLNTNITYYSQRKQLTFRDTPPLKKESEERAKKFHTEEVILSRSG